MRPATRQDIDSAINRACENISKNMLRRSDIQSINNQVRSDLLKDLRVLHGENQAVMKQSAEGRNQVFQRLQNLEQNIARVENLLQAVLQQQTQTSNRVKKMETTTADAGYLFQRI